MSQLLNLDAQSSILTSSLLAWIPHRHPMIWIDEIISFGPKGGDCLVHLNSDGAYMTNGKLRPSCLIEFIAQAQAFVGICNARKLESSAAPFREAFLVAVTDANFEHWHEFQEGKDGSTLTVKVCGSRTLGPIHLFSGSVWTASNRCLGSANIKAFINSSRA